MEASNTPDRVEEEEKDHGPQTYSYTFHGKRVCVQDTVRSDLDLKRSTGFSVWFASVVLLRYLEKDECLKALTDKFQLPPAIEKWRLLDMSAGTGLFGLALATKGAYSVETDIPTVVDYLQVQVKENESLVDGRVCVVPFSWGESIDPVANAMKELANVKSETAPTFHVGFSIDTVFFPASMPELREDFVHAHLELVRECSVVLLCFEERHTWKEEEEVLDMLREKMEVIPLGKKEKFVPVDLYEEIEFNHSCAGMLFASEVEVHLFALRQK